MTFTLTQPESKRFTERAAASPAAYRVDREAGIVHGVKVIGLISRNGRDYPAQTLRDAIPLYEGARVFINHRESGEGDRKFQHWAGILVNVRFDRDGLYADLQLRKAGEHFESICEAAERFPGSFGLSHEADGSSYFRNGREVIDKLNEVASVDIVMDPASNANLYENIDMPAAAADSGPVTWADMCELQRLFHDYMRESDARNARRFGSSHTHFNESSSDYESRFLETAERSRLRLREAKARG